MKQNQTNLRFAAPYLAALTVIGLTTFTVFAAPSATPTGGNVDARFSTVGTGASGSETFLVNSDGTLTNPSSNNGGKVTVNDPDGLQSLQGGVEASNSGNNPAIRLDAGTWMATDSGRPNPGDPTDGERIWLRDLDGVDVRGPLRDWGPANNPLRFDDDQGVQIQNSLGTVGLLLGADGSISNPGPNNGGAVTVSDTNGFAVTLPTAPVRFKVDGASGGISNPTGTEPVKINDTDGLNILGPLWNPTNYLTLGNPNWNPSDYSGTNYINLTQPIGNYASKAITGAYTATQCQNDAGIASGGTCWYPLIVRDEEGIAMTTNSGGKRQTNLLIGSDGKLSNPGPNNNGQVSVKDKNGLDVDATGGFSDGIDVENDNGMVFYGSTTNADGMYVGTYSDNRTAITADANYDGSTAFYGDGGYRVLAGQANGTNGTAIDVAASTVGANIGVPTTGTGVLARSYSSSSGGTFPGGGIAGRFEAYKGIGVIGNAKDGGQAGKFYYLTTATGGLENNRVDLSTPSYSVNAWGPINTYNHMTSSGGFGGIYVKRGSGTTVAAGAENYFAISCNSSNDRALSFNFENSGWKSYQDDTRFDTAYGGHFYVKNTDTSSETVTPYVVCFSPTAGW